MDDSVGKMLGLHRAEFEKAKHAAKLAWVFEFVVIAFALASLFVGVDRLVYAFTVIALVAVSLKWVFTFRTERLRETAERARRILTLVNGFGYEVSNKELTDLLASFTATEEEGKKWEDAEYFVANEERGYERFAAILQESSFYSKHLYDSSARQVWTWFIVVSVVSVLALLALPSVSNQQWVLTIAQVVSLILMFLVSADLLGRAMAFTGASNTIAKIDERLEGHNLPDFDEHDLIFIWGDYNAAVQNTPLIPTNVYEKQKDKLSELFARRINRENG